MLNLKNRWLPLALLCAISCAAAAERPQQMAGDWPREIDARGSKIIVFEPQLESFRGSRLITRAAVSLTRENASEPVFGALWLDAVMSTDAARRTVTPVVIKVGDLRFPNLSADEAARLRQDIGDDLSRWNLTYSVDALLAEVRLIEEQKAAAAGLKADAPQVYFRNGPAVLLALQDESAWRKSSDSAYQRLQGSPFFVLRDAASGTSYLHIPPFWWTSTDPRGAWQAVENVPDTVADVWKNETPPQQPAADPGPRPEVIPVTGAAELVWTDGVPQYAPITGTDLLYIRNTDSDVFLEIQTQTTYALFSGRWYRTRQGKSEWQFVASEQLPADFARIPITSEKRHVLACVAGTAQAQAALKNAEIPQTEAIKPGPAPDLKAIYDGEPQFTDIPDIGVSYAVNTPYSIFSVPGRYYWCDDGIWYDAASPDGPWVVSVGVPRAIYLIPPSCPHYYVTYCHIFGVSPDAVYVGYYPGYRGCYAWGGSVVYGTGWNYRPWVGTRCYTRPVTWGLGVRYSSAANGWAVSVGGGLAPHRPSGDRAPQLQAGAGGYWGGGVHGYRDPSPSPTPPNLYDHQPDRRAPNPARPPRDLGSYRDPHHEPDRTPMPPRDHPEGRKDPLPSQPDRPRTPLTPPREHPDTPRTPAPPRDPHNGPTPSQPEHPRTPPPPPRESPRTPPPSTDRETPPRENRESPKTPPPQREAPRTPPPSPQREAPRTPAPQREAPRTPPPQREQREAPRRQEPPPRRESPNDSPRSPDRKR